MPNCTENSTMLKLALYQHDGLGWNDLNLTIKKTSGDLTTLIERTLEVNRQMDAEWLCFTVDCYEAIVGNISQSTIINKHKIKH